MQKVTLKSFILLLFCAPAALAQELGPFNTQDVDYAYPDNMNNYIATKAPVAPLDNHYIGISGGVDSSSGKFTNQFALPGFMPLTADLSETSLDYNAGIFGGYGTNFDNFYIAGEAGANYTTMYEKVTDSVTTSPFAPANISTRQPFTLSLDVLPGFLTNTRSVLLYGRLGIAASLVQLKLNADSGDPNNPISQSNYKCSFGARVGAGIEYFFVDAFSMRAEYVYSKYGKVNNTYSRVSPIPMTFSYSVKPSNSQINLGFNFHF